MAIRLWWKFNMDVILRIDIAISKDDTHYASLADQFAFSIPLYHHIHQSRLDFVQLITRVPQASYFDNSRSTYVEPGACR